VWHDYMTVAQGADCPDFPAPENPVEFSTWSGSHTVAEPSARTVTPQPVKPSGRNSSGGTQGGQNGQYPPDLYAPGAGQGPEPVPGGGGGGGGDHSGGGTGGGGTP
jgi:hypothetical protein